MFIKAITALAAVTALAAPAQHSTTAQHKSNAPAHHVAPVTKCVETDGSGKQAFPCWSEEGFTINNTHKACVYNSKFEGDSDTYWNGTKGVWFTHTYPNGKVVKTCAL